MKKSIILVAATVLVGSCGFLKNTTVSADNGDQTATTSQASASQTNAAQSAGQGAGSALLNLYNQYKADGNKYDYQNMQNILNTVTLVANCEGLKDNYKDKNYLGEFGKGLMASSLGLVTKDNVEGVTNSLVDMVKSSDTAKNATTTAKNTANTAAGYAATAAQYAGSISSLLSLFGSK